MSGASSMQTGGRRHEARGDRCVVSMTVRRGPTSGARGEGGGGGGGQEAKEHEDASN